MRITQLATVGFASNCWLLTDEKSREAAVIDPSADTDEIVEVLRKESLTLSMILLTHGHFDHIFSADKLRDCTGAPLYIHEKDAHMLTDPVANASAVFFGKGDCYRAPEKLLKGGDALLLGEEIIHVRHTPGHTAGSVCFVTSHDLFAGDTLFHNSIGRTDLPGGDAAILSQSLARLIRMPGDYTVYPGHGEITTLKKEQKYNPFLQDLDVSTFDFQGDGKKL